MTTEFAAIIEQGDYDHYGVRAHRSTAIVGEYLGCSKVWIEGECTADELNGISTLKVRAGDDLDKAIDRLRREYCWGGETIVLVGGYHGSWGEDAGEYIIRDNICLAAL